MAARRTGDPTSSSHADGRRAHRVGRRASLSTDSGDPSQWPVPASSPVGRDDAVRDCSSSSTSAGAHRWGLRTAIRSAIELTACRIGAVSSIGPPSALRATGCADQPCRRRCADGARVTSRRPHGCVDLGRCAGSSRATDPSSMTRAASGWSAVNRPWSTASLCAAPGRRRRSARTRRRLADGSRPQSIEHRATRRADRTACRRSISARRSERRAAPTSSGLPQSAFRHRGDQLDHVPAGARRPCANAPVGYVGRARESSVLIAAVVGTRGAGRRQRPPPHVRRRRRSSPALTSAACDCH